MFLIVFNIILQYNYSAFVTLLLLSYDKRNSLLC